MEEVVELTRRAIQPRLPIDATWKLVVKSASMTFIID
jgi:hypothetical protein